ncbi:unnamed protein product [Calicophoron daubneyi]|uniref:FAR1 domain-containing protein n=1 Tax=Calicophoron daubneyi TaxID=300641 RepID=A0AAV2T3G3_CALDB
MSSSDFSNEFSDLLLHRVFQSFQEFEEALKVFEDKTNTKFARYSSSAFKSDSKLKFLKAKYVCNRGRERPSASTGSRHTPTSKCNCLAQFNIRCTFEGLKVVSGRMDHNHSVDEQEVSMQPHRRLLTPAQKEQVSSLVQHGYAIAKIKDYCKERFQKRLTTYDVVNLRRVYQHDNSEYAYGTQDIKSENFLMYEARSRFQHLTWRIFLWALVHVSHQDEKNHLNQTFCLLEYGSSHKSGISSPSVTSLTGLFYASMNNASYSQRSAESRLCHISFP